ncbi:MAG: FAD binding domain-containing protein [Sphingomonadaceae bacterium]
MSLYPSLARPNSLRDAAELLASLASGGVVIAGGQELMPSVNHGVLAPDVYVDIGGLQELRGISEMADGRIAIGALTVHRELQTDPLVRAKLPLLAHAATRAGGGRQVHNRGTIGGNLVAQHPLYDLAPSLLALEAEVEWVKGAETVRQPLAAMLKESSHGLGREAILTRVLVAPMEPLPDGPGWAYEKLKASGGAYGSANAAACVRVTDAGVTWVRLVVGAVADRLLDASEQAASVLVGRTFDPEIGNLLAERVSGLVEEPLSDAQGDGQWRRAMAGVVARRAVSSAVARAREA